MRKAGCLNNCADIGRRNQTGNSSFIFRLPAYPWNGQYKKPQGSELNGYGYRHAVLKGELEFYGLTDENFERI